jgi:nanoRNase/pAp phosphatase (c-di-AMP/oligoRNAs hydrolase)
MSAQVFREFLYSNRTAAKLDRLRAQLSPHDSLGIILYGEPDPDALAAGWALMQLLRTRVQRITMVACRPTRRQQNLRLMAALKIPLTITADIPWDDFTKLAVVDAQPDFFSPAPPRTFDIVIDHHPKRGKYSFKFSDVRPRYGSTSTILVEYLVAAGDILSKKMASALWYGLRTDSDNLSRPVHTADLAAYVYLYRRSNRDIIQWLDQSEVPSAYRDYFIMGLQTLSPGDKRLVVYLGEVPSGDVCVMLADFLSRFIGLHWVAVGGIVKSKLHVVFRRGAYDVNVGRIARTKLGQCGSAGGHQDKARAEIPLKLIAEQCNGNTGQVEIAAWLDAALLRSRSRTRMTAKRKA